MRVRVEDVSSNVFKIEAGDVVECEAATDELNGAAGVDGVAVPRPTAKSKAKSPRTSKKVVAPVVPVVTEVGW
jgi:hypothetical protein